MKVMFSPCVFVKLCLALTVAVATFLSPIASAQTQAPVGDIQKRLGQAGAYVNKALEDIIRLLPPKTVADIHPKAISMELAVKFLSAHVSELGQGTDTAAVSAALESISLADKKLSSAADNSDAIGAAKYVDEIRTLWDDVKTKVPAGAFAMKLDPPVYGCIMHSAQTRPLPGTCPVCGMAMIPKQAFQVALNQPVHTVLAKVHSDAPLQAGKEAHCTLHLQTIGGAPVSVKDLAVVHTQPLHLLIIDESLSDYHHEHPIPSAEPGAYNFTFVPKKPGSYRLFADIAPNETGRQEYARADIQGAVSGEALSDRTPVLQAHVEDLTYTLSFDHEHLVPGEPIAGKVHIVKSQGGEPFANLEPVMGVFAHLVGFYEDRETVMHIHPQGPDPVPPASRGGPDLEFQFIAPKAGFVRFYVQVQIGGVNKFAPFSLNFEESQPRTASATAPQ